MAQTHRKLPVSHPLQVIRVGHSPDPDDAFMFYALAQGKIETPGLQFQHELVDIETLNRRAGAGELELTALSLHAYAYVAERYALCTCGVSMGDGYGPLVVARRPLDAQELRSAVVAAPGTLTTAWLALRLYRGEGPHVVVPFEQILGAVAAGHYQGTPVDAGLIIHEGQLTYGEAGLASLVDLGAWWLDSTGLPLPLGVNAIRKDLGPALARRINRLMRQSIDYALEHREEALAYALQYGRDLSRQQADRFVGMYVNEWTRDFGPRGRHAVSELLRRGHEAGIIPRRVEAEYVE
jgi:1,4-dihydroxy-6-naphthoate synthase